MVRAVEFDVNLKAVAIDSFGTARNEKKYDKNELQRFGKDDIPSDGLFILRIDFRLSIVASCNSGVFSGELSSVNSICVKILNFKFVFELLFILPLEGD